jgi:hypothetical protein
VKTLKKAPAKITPVLAALRDESPLRASVKPGLSAIKKADAYILDKSIRGEFEDSLDLDDATRAGREGENRWDYLLGHTSSKIIGVEPHSATNGEVSVVIAKKQASQRVLLDHFREGVTVSSWNWVSSGTVGLMPLDKVRLRLAQNGISFVGRSLRKTHLSNP